MEWHGKHYLPKAKLRHTALRTSASACARPFQKTLILLGAVSPVPLIARIPPGLGGMQRPDLFQNVYLAWALFHSRFVVEKKFALIFQVATTLLQLIFCFPTIYVIVRVPVSSSSLSSCATHLSTSPADSPCRINKAVPAKAGLVYPSGSSSDRLVVAPTRIPPHAPQARAL